MAKKGSGPEMWADLTCDENWVLRNKLGSGAATAAYGNHDYDIHSEVHEVLTDLHAAWNERFGREHP
jgi:hypothetical protein